MEFKKLEPAALLERLPAKANVDLDLADYVVPRATMGELISLGEALVAHAPAVLSTLEAAALEDVHQGCQLADHVVEHNTAIVRMARTNKVKGLRYAVITEDTSLRATLQGMTRSKATAVAEKAVRVHAALFDGMPELNGMGPRRVWYAARNLCQRLDKEATLAVELHELVPASMTEVLREAVAALGAALGLSRNHGEAARIETAVVIAALRRHFNRYVAAMIAGTTEVDVAARMRAEAALRPVLELRVEVGRRHARRTGEAAEGVDAGEDDEDVDPTVVAPAGDDG